VALGYKGVRGGVVIIRVWRLSDELGRRAALAASERTKAICALGIAALLAVISSAYSLPACRTRVRSGAACDARSPSIMGPGLILVPNLGGAWETGHMTDNFAGAA
jgi:hypothetical protein